MSIVHTKDKWIDLGSLPRCKNKDYIDWENSIGVKVPFHYANLNGEIEILEYDSEKKKIKGKYLDIEFEQVNAKFKKCEILALYWLSDRFRYKIGDIIKDEKRDFIIFDRYYKLEKNEQYPRPYYKCKCNRDGYEFDLMEKLIFDKHQVGCSVCAGRTVIKDINSIYKTDPWLIPYFKNIEDTYKYTRSSNQIVDMTCPNCGKERMYCINHLSSNGYLPCSCGDGWSYPNKFMYKLFSTLNIKFTSEKQFKWSGRKVYDTYIELENGKKIVVEAHGKQHYYDVEGLFESYEHQTMNDKYKKELAIKNGIDYYFEIDCRKSDIDWIKKNIISSGLLELLEIHHSSIDWVQCAKFAESNLTKEICEFAENNCHLTRTEIYKELKLSRNAVIKALQRGQKLGWISKEAINIINDNGKNNSRDSLSKPVYDVKLDMYFYNTTKVLNWYKDNLGINLKRCNIFDSMDGRKNRLYDIDFNRITKEEFNKKKLESPNKCVGDFFNV